MADLEDDPSKVTALYPDPPPFWKDFTPANLARIESLKQDYAEQQGIDVDTVVRISDIPEDLTYLQPPAEPTDAKWRLFSEPQSIDDELQDLETAGIQRLGPAGEADNRDGKHVDRAFELKRLAKSLLLNFLELMGIMSINPEQGSEKMQDLRTLFLNLHHVLNEYRPHQAREQLIQLMQDQLDSKRAETAAIRGVVDKAKRALEGLGSMEIPPVESEGGDRAGADADRMDTTTDESTMVLAGTGTHTGSGQAAVDDDAAAYWERERAGWAQLDAEFG